ncbi:MAG: BlaI/MecI/CopY family transcriptional regulator [Pirellulales bacterium]
MSENQLPSRAELEVLQVVYELGSCTSREAFDAYPNDRGMEHSSVRTLLRRLAAKGFLKGKLVDGVTIYSPVRQQRSVLGDVVSDLVHTFFQGDVFPLVQHLLGQRRLSSQQVDELREMLDGQASSAKKRKSTK